MSWVAIAAAALIAQCADPNALRVTFTAPDGGSITICDGEANDQNGGIGTPNHVIDFNVTVSGTFAVRGELRESVDTGMKRLILSWNPDNTGVFPGTFENTGGAAGTCSVAVASSVFGAVQLRQLSLHFRGTASDPAPSNGYSVTAQSVGAIIGGIPLTMTPSSVSGPAGGSSTIEPQDVVNMTNMPSSVTRLTGTWSLRLGSGDQVQLPSSLEISAQQVVPGGRLIVGMNAQRLAFTLGPVGGESVFIFDGGAGDLSPGGPGVVDNIIDFSTMVGGVFDTRAHLTETVGPGTKQLVLRENPSLPGTFPGTFRNISTVESTFALTATTSPFATECFGGQSLSYDGTASDPAGGATPVRISSHSVTTTSPFAVSVIGPVIDLPTGGSSSFGPITNSASGQQNAIFLSFRWDFRAGRGDQIQIPGTIQTTASLTSGCPIPPVPALSDFGLIAAILVLIALFWLRTVTRSSSHG